MQLGATPCKDVSVQRGVGTAGLEPARAEAHRILSPVRLPVRHMPESEVGLYIFKLFRRDLRCGGMDLSGNRKNNGRHHHRGSGNCLQKNDS